MGIVEAVGGEGQFCLYVMIFLACQIVMAVCALFRD